MKFENAPENQVGLGKRIGVTDGPKADIFSRPRAETFYVEQRLAKGRGILILGERNSPCQHAPAEFAYRLPARVRGSNRAQVGVSQDFDCRKQAGDLSRQWMRDLAAIVVNELADEICPLLG